MVGLNDVGLVHLGLIVGMITTAGTGADLHRLLTQDIGAYPVLCGLLSSP
jgi:hypothetical protein